MHQAGSHFRLPAFFAIQDIRADFSRMKLPKAKDVE
jgi:hypothetical protein